MLAAVSAKPMSVRREKRGRTVTVRDGMQSRSEGVGPTNL